MTELTGVVAEFDRDAAATWCDALWSDHTGFAVVAFGRDGYFEAGRYRFREWSETCYVWPAERNRLLDDIGRALVVGDKIDVYACPLLRIAERRAKGNAAHRDRLFWDIDGPVSDDVVTVLGGLGGYAVNSGRPGHAHVFLPLTTDVTAAQRERLCRAVALRLDHCDAKWSDNDVLRVPGTSSFKTNPPTPVTWRLPPNGHHGVDAVTLAAIYGADLDIEASGGEATAATAEPVDEAALPVWLRERLARPLEPSDDRSSVFHGLVGASRDAHLTQGQAVTVMTSWARRVEFDRYDRRMAQEVARCWEKIDDPDAWMAGLPIEQRATHAAAGDGEAASPESESAGALPDVFWSARPALRHIRQAAWSRGRSAEAVLGAVLARVAADTLFTVKLPPTVGGRCGLSLLVALTGPPGSGKSSSKGIAVELVRRQVLAEECDDVPPGSGEGLIEILFDFEEDLETGKKVKKLARHNVFAHVDEGEILATQARRNSTNTIWPIIRSVFTDGVLGQANASAERKRRVPAGHYVYGIVIGIQPDKAGDLLSDAGGGTPQRILWMPTSSPVPAPGERPEWPGELARPKIERRNPVDGYVFALDAEVAAEVQGNDHQRQQHGCDPLDEHHDLIRLKVGGILAVLDGRLTLSAEDWRLAGMVTDLSRRTRSGVLATLKQHQREANVQRGYADAERIEARDEAAVKRIAKIVMRKLVDADDWMASSRLRRSFTSADRGYVDVAVDRLVTAGIVAVESGRGTRYRATGGSES